MESQQVGNRRSGHGLGIGIVVGSLMTLLAIVSGHEPETVLFRGVMSGIVIGGLARVLETIIVWGFAEDD